MKTNCSDKLRILLVDDHTLFRNALAVMLSNRGDMEIVGQAESGAEGVTLAGELMPDLVLMDVHMPDGNGIAAVKAIKKATPQVRVVMLSGYDDEDDLFGAIKSGADGYLLKSMSPAELHLMLEAVRRGETLISGVIADKILHELRQVDREPDRPAAGQGLTLKESETLDLLAQGKSNREIADALCLSESTVKHHLVSIMEKLHLQNRTQLAIYALREGLVGGN